MNVPQTHPGRQTELQKSVSRFITILSNHDVLTLPDVAELIISMTRDIQNIVVDGFSDMEERIVLFEAEMAPLKKKLSGVNDDALPQVIRYVAGDSLANPGGLPREMKELMTSVAELGKSINSLKEILNSDIHLLREENRKMNTRLTWVTGVMAILTAGFLYLLIGQIA